MEPLRRPSAEAGFALVETMVSAVVLLVGIAALFLGLDVQNASSGVSRASSVAGGLAEADQERLRSFRVPQLSNRYESRSVSVAGSTYTVISDVDWIRDSTGGTQSCANFSTQADYLRLTTTVTGRTGGQSPPAPVRLRSLVAPPVGQFGINQGTVAVKTAGGAGQPIQGATTTITGPTTLNDTTNELGCAVFGYVPVGSYTAQVSASGFVDPSGAAVATAPATASLGTVNLTSLQYDRSASANVSFDTKVGTAAAQAATSSSLSAANAGVPATGFRLFTASQPASTIAATALFPFASEYTLYGGSCPQANPAEYVEDYFDTHPGSVVLAPGSTTTATVRMPALRLTTRTATGGAAVRVRVKSVDTGCADAFTYSLTTGALTGTAPNASATAALPATGLPFGHYSVCAETGGKRKSLASNLSLTDEAGSALLEIDLRSGTTTGTCP